MKKRIAIPVVMVSMCVMAGGFWTYASGRGEHADAAASTTELSENGVDIQKVGAEKSKRVGLRLDFSKTELDGKEIPTGWTFRGKSGTPAPKFSLKQEKGGSRYLSILSEKSSGVLLYDIGAVDLEQFPVMRWRWKMVRYPAGADVRESKKDDQGIALYLGYGKMWQRSLAYMWQTETPKETDGRVKYGGGFVDVSWVTVRNKDDGSDVWITEERNVRDDIKRHFKTLKLPAGLALSISSNSQYTGTDAESAIEFIEFVEE